MHKQYIHMHVFLVAHIQVIQVIQYKSKNTYDLQNTKNFSNSLYITIHECALHVCCIMCSKNVGLFCKRAL